MDEADLGSRSEAFHLELALRRHENAACAGRTECIDCGEPIPEARRRAAPGCRRCIHCQIIFEREGG